MFYNMKLEENVLTVSFGEPATNDQIVAEVSASLNGMIKEGVLGGGQVIKIDGPASLPVAFAIAHAVTHRYGVVAVKDPKLGKFVVAVSHDPKYQPGQLID